MLCNLLFLPYDPSSDAALHTFVFAQFNHCKMNAAGNNISASEKLV